MERYEFVKNIAEPDNSKPEELYKLDVSRKFVCEHLSGNVTPDELHESIIISNSRQKFDIYRENEGHSLERYELAFDSVKYLNMRNERSHTEKQIELELKSDPTARLSMQLLTNSIERALKDLNLEVMTESKYERAKRFTEDNADQK